MLSVVHRRWWRVGVLVGVPFGTLGRARTCDLLIRSQIREVLGMRETPIDKRVSVR